MQVQDGNYVRGRSSESSVLRVLVSLLRWLEPAYRRLSEETECPIWVTYNVPAEAEYPTYRTPTACVREQEPDVVCGDLSQPVQLWSLMSTS